MAFRRRLGNLARTLLDQRLKYQAAEHQSGLIAQRQQDLAEQQAQTALLQQAFGDPTGQIFDSLRKAGVGRVGSWPIEPFAPTAERAMGTVGKQIADVSDLAKLPTESDVSTLYERAPGAGYRMSLPGAGVYESQRPDIETLLQQRKAKETGLIAEAKRAMEAQPLEVEGYGPDSVTQQKMSMTRGELRQQPVPTQLTPAQEVSRFNTVQGGTQAQRGQTAEAEALGSARGQWLDPEVQAQRIALERARAGAGIEADVRKAGMIENLKFLNAMQNTVMTLGPEIDETIALSLTVNQALGSDWIGRFKEVLGSATQLDPRAANLDRRIRNIAQRLANDPFFGGNKGATSENDRLAVEGRFARAGTGQELTQELSRLGNDLKRAYEAISSLPLDATGIARKNAARRALGLRLLGPDNEALPDGTTPVEQELLRR